MLEMPNVAEVIGAGDCPDWALKYTTFVWPPAVIEAPVRRPSGEATRAVAMDGSDAAPAERTVRKATSSACAGSRTSSRHVLELHGLSQTAIAESGLADSSTIAIEAPAGSSVSS